MTQIHRAVHAIGIRINDELDLTQPEALVLYFLGPRGAAPLEEVQHAFLHRRSTLTNVLQRLEERGLVERIPAVHDRRRFDVKLTKEGRRIAGDVSALFEDIAASAGASRAQIRSAAGLLSKIADLGEAEG